MKTIYLAGGCFWGLQKFIDQFDGVTETEVGYANGPDRAPTYQEVCLDSGHAETVRVVYDEAVISLEKLLEYYFMVIDPLSVNRQGEDKGIQYRTGVYYSDESQRPVIETVFARERVRRWQWHWSPFGISSALKSTTRNTWRKTPTVTATSPAAISPSPENPDIPIL